MVHFIDDWDVYNDNFHVSKFVNNFRKIIMSASTRYTNKKVMNIIIYLGPHGLLVYIQDFSIQLQRKHLLSLDLILIGAMYIFIIIKNGQTNFHGLNNLYWIYLN